MSPFKELKYDCGAGNFNSRSFWSTETALSIVMMAYNLMSLFRQGVLQSKTQPFLKTLRYSLLNIGAYTVRKGNQKVLKLALQMKRREWFLGLWSKTALMLWPLAIPT